MMIQPARTYIAAVEYFQLPIYKENNLIQLIDGEGIIGMPPTPQHQDIVGEIFYFFKSIAKQQGGKAYTSPIEVYLDEYNLLQPDVLYLKPGSQCTVGDKRLTGAPDLVVEVLSPSTAKYDRQAKYAAYERHGVSEYWIVDPTHMTIEVYILRERQFALLGAFSHTDIFQSPTLNEPVMVNHLISEAD